VLLQHSDCGTSHLTKDLIHERIATAKEPGTAETVRMRDEVCEWKVSKGEESVRQDLEYLRTKGFLRDDLVDGAVGFWMDTATGVVKQIQ
jgi:carbonic anhydrase